MSHISFFLINRSGFLVGNIYNWDFIIFKIRLLEWKEVWFKVVFKNGSNDAIKLWVWYGLLGLEKCLRLWLCFKIMVVFLVWNTFGSGGIFLQLLPKIAIFYVWRVVWSFQFVVVVMTHIVTMKGKGDDKLKVNVIVSFLVCVFLHLILYFTKFWICQLFCKYSSIYN